MICADFSRLGEQAKELEAAGADFLHFDIMDGHFVPNLTFGHLILQHLRPAVSLPFEAHLMVEEPGDIIARMVQAGANMISVHAEACRHLQRTLAQIRSLGAKAGVALNPSTPLDALLYVLEDLDFILLMSVNPGFAGQKFIPSAKQKAADLSVLLRAEAREIEIQMDGNIVPANIAELAQAGVHSFAIGSGLFEGHASLAEGLKAYRQAAARAEVK